MKDDEVIRHSGAGGSPSNSRKSGVLKEGKARIEKRRSARIPMRIPVVLSWQDCGNAQVAEVNTFTISRFGCALHSELFLLPGTLLKLRIAKKSIAGRVVHTLKDHSTNLVTIGVAFDEDATNFWQVDFEFLAATSLP